MNREAGSGGAPNTPTRQVDRGLLDEWKRAQCDLEGFLDSVNAGSDAHTVAVWFLEQAITSPDAFADTLSPQVASDGRWSFATSLSVDGQRHGVAFPVSEVRPTDPLAFLLIEAHSLLGAWWLVCAWRARELARATALLADSGDSVAAASCARPLVETAAATWVDAKKLASAWEDVKRGGTPSKNSEFLSKRVALRVLLDEVLYGAKFDDRAPDEKAMWGRVQRSNVLGQIEKLAKAGCSKLQSDYQWLCNTVHPSLGNMFAYSAPPSRHVTGTHIRKRYGGRPIPLRRSDGSEFADQTVAVATARGVSVALRVLRITLDAALRVIDDVGLTSGAPALARDAYWRKISVPERNDPCPCRSGLKMKKCRHAWGEAAPTIPDRFSPGDLLPPSTAAGPAVH